MRYECLKATTLLLSIDYTPAIARSSETPATRIFPGTVASGAAVFITVFCAAAFVDETWAE